MASSDETEEYTRLSDFSYLDLQQLGLDELRTCEHVAVSGWGEDGSFSPRLREMLFRMLKTSKPFKSVTLASRRGHAGRGFQQLGE